MIYCVLQQNVEVVPHVKKCGVENPKNVDCLQFVKKYTLFIFFAGISVLFVKLIFTKG